MSGEAYGSLPAWIFSFPNGTVSEIGGTLVGEFRNYDQMPGIVVWQEEGTWGQVSA